MQYGKLKTVGIYPPFYYLIIYNLYRKVYRNRIYYYSSKEELKR